MESNICRFIPYRQDHHPIHCINFVLETKSGKNDKLHSESVYKLHYVRSGSGYLHLLGKTDRITQGDVFFTFPAHPFRIEKGPDMTYMYVSFVGTRGNMLMDGLNVSKNNYLFHAGDSLLDFWYDSLGYPSELSDLVSESVLLYTFAFLGKKSRKIESPERRPSGFDVMKKYVDDHFTESDFSLDRMSRELSYNKKYVSGLFMKKMRVRLIDYVNTVRIQYACKMLEQGFTGISDVASQCGYRDPQYFSKLFKKKTGVTPTEYSRRI